VVTNTTINNFTTITSLPQPLLRRGAMRCYPNPAKDKLFVESSKFKVQSSKLSVIDVLGNEVMSEIITSNSIELNIQSLVKGIYFLRIQNGETLKFVKQ
jgi:hypothetical protein